VEEEEKDCWRGEGAEARGEAEEERCHRSAVCEGVEHGQQL
jgi:hypothetical protein